MAVTNLKNLMTITLLLATATASPMNLIGPPNANNGQGSQLHHHQDPATSTDPPSGFPHTAVHPTATAPLVPTGTATGVPHPDISGSGAAPPSSSHGNQFGGSRKGGEHHHYPNIPLPSETHESHHGENFPTGRPHASYPTATAAPFAFATLTGVTHPTGGPHPYHTGVVAHGPLPTTEQ
ncbi:hypothetical protein EJ03DRAFT_371065 [Teratosphaeria nubilosa]|uniref:Uncharacterized protein n=1 Tax=Teratosphaeria nubilosa TaxID=161662 RepID=A0A6G1LL44_9PEZI|nr:hypothetical protein EJ03DRAFT_371065 [Teratosphaeria nubilosa]